MAINEWDDAAASVLHQQDQQLRNAFINAQKVNPDAEARARRNAAITGVPVQTARDLPQVVENQAKLAGFNTQRLQQQFPATAQWLIKGGATAEDHGLSNMDLVYDDIPAIATVEGQINRSTSEAVPTPARAAWDRITSSGLWRDVGRYVGGSGPDSLGSDALAAADILSGKLGYWMGSTAGSALGAVGLNHASDAAMGAAKFYADQADRTEAQAPQGFHNKLVRNIAGLGLQLPMMMATGGAAEAAPVAEGVQTLGQFLAGSLRHATASMAVPALTDSTDTARKVYEQTGDNVQAARAGLSQYLNTTASGVMPMSAPGGVAMRATSGAVAQMVQGEAGRVLMNQVMPEHMQSQFNWEDLLLSGITGAMLGTMGPRSAPSMAAELVDQQHKQALAAIEANKAAEVLQGVTEAANTAKLKERDPLDFRQFVEHASEGKPVQDLWVDAKTFDQAMHQAGVTPYDLQRTMPHVAEQMEAAAGTGGDVRLPLADWATHIAGTGLENTLLQDVRVGRPDAMSLRESQDFAGKSGDLMKAQAEKLTADQKMIDARTADRQAVAGQMRQQLEATGRYRPEVSDAYSQLVSHFYSAMADRTGKTAGELYAERPLRVGAEDLAGNGVLTQDARAAYSPETNTIGLFKSADLSSFLHESGHGFLKMFGDISGQIEGGIKAGESVSDGERQVHYDMGKLLDWMGVKGDDQWTALDRWHSMSLDEQREAHEKFARGFERYLMEGKAPNLEVRGIFQRFRSWLLNIYRHVSALNVDLNDEVRGVMDRMLASDEAIRTAEAAASFEPLFKNPEDAAKFGLDFEAYTKVGEQATADAVDEMQKRSIKDMAWLGRARDKALREVEKRAAEVRKGVEADVRKEVYKEPVYQAWQFLKGDAHAEGADPEMVGKLRTNDLREMLGTGEDAAWRRLSAERMTSDTVGQHPDLVAERFGFASGRDLVEALARAEHPDSVIEGMTDQRMLEAHAELATPDAVQRAADEAVHNEARARFVTTEMMALDQAMRVRKQTGTDKRGNALTVDALMAQAKRTAHDVVHRMTLADAQPARFQAAESRAGRRAAEALAKDDIPAAAAAKRDQVLNTHMVREAQAAQQMTEKALKYFKRFDKDSIRNKIDLQDREQIDALLERFDLRKNPAPDGLTGSERKQAQDLQTWIDAQRANGYSPLATADMVNPSVRKPYREMTVEQMQGLFDTIRSIEHIGRERRTITVDGKKMDLEEAVAPIVTKLQERGEKFTDAELAEAPRAGVDPAWKIALDRLGVFVRTSNSEVLRWDYKSNKYDNHEVLGPFQKAVTERLLNASYEFGDRMDKVAKIKAERMKEYGLDKKWQESLNDLVGNHGLLDNSLDKPAPRRLTRGDMIGIAMHVGNESNFAKLTEGMGWEPDAVWAALHANMREQDWNAARLLGELAGMHWDDMVAMNRRLGVDTPEKIQPRPFPTKFGEMPGWYAPIRYDPIRSKLGRKKGEAAAINPGEGLFDRGYFRADTTTNGSLNARETGYRDFVDLDWHPIEKSITDTVRDLSFREALMDAHKVVNNPELRAQFMRTFGREEHKHLNDWLGRLVNSEVGDEKQSQFVAISAGFRRAMVANGVAFRISTMIKHGGSAAWKSLGMLSGESRGYFAKRLALMVTDHNGQVTDAMEKFPEIRQRARQQDRDFHQGVAGIFEPESVHGKAERFGHAGVAYMDFFTAVPTAWAAYDMAITKGIPKSLGGDGTPMSEAAAVAYANKMVREAHGSTNEASQSLLISNRAEIVKIMTVLHGFMNNAYGQNADTLDKALHAHGFSKPELLARVMLAQVVPAAMAGWATFGGPHDDESTLGWLLHHVGGELAGTLPMVRDLWGLVVDGRADAGGSPMIRAGGDLHKLGKAAVKYAEGETERVPVKPLGNVAGLVLPGLGQIGSTAQYATDLFTGYQQPPESVGEAVRGVMTGNSKPYHKP